MAPGKRGRKSPVAAVRTLPLDLLLEIVARSEPTTLVSCAAACKSLRREILDPPFLRRVVLRIIPPCILASLHHNRGHNPKLGPLVSLVHPATPVASSFTDGMILTPYMLRHATGDIHGSYEPMMSRGGLVALRRQHSSTSIDRTPEQRCYDLCVFNPMTGDHTYLPCRRGLYPHWFQTYVLLTAADGIGCSFMLLATIVDRCHESGGFRITVQATETGGTSWGPVTSDAHALLPYRPFQHQREEPVVLHGGIIHWLLSEGDHVLTYDICTQRLGTVKLPPTNCGPSQRILRMSPHGRLRLLGAKRFMVSMWVHLSDGWAKEAVIDVEHIVPSSLHLLIPIDIMRIDFKCSGDRSGVVLLKVPPGLLVVLDLETKEMRTQKSLHTSLFLEVDLPARLRAMKIYS